MKNCRFSRESNKWDSNRRSQKEAREESRRSPWRPEIPKSLGKRQALGSEASQGSSKKSANGSDVDKQMTLSKANAILGGTLHPDSTYLPTSMNVLAFKIVKPADKGRVVVQRIEEWRTRVKCPFQASVFVAA